MYNKLLYILIFMDQNFMIMYSKIVVYTIYYVYMELVE